MRSLGRKPTYSPRPLLGLEVTKKPELAVPLWLALVLQVGSTRRDWQPVEWSL
jgi:hypothetical protein